MTILILIVGLAVPCVLVLIAPSLPPVRRMAKVDRTHMRRVHLSAPVLVIDEHGRSEFDHGKLTVAQARSEAYRFWWLRQPMRTGDRILPEDELDLSPVSIVPQEPSGTPLPERPARLKKRDRTRVRGVRVGLATSGADS